jgi:alkylation response protein AidB-like acyl-CoA dehydrogenase
MTVTEDELSRAVETFVDEGKGLDEHDFLAAQFDAGFAWIRNPQGTGGRGAPDTLQRVVDDVLEANDRLYGWYRNPMGIGMCAPAIVEHGTAEQRARYLRSIFTADELWCQLFSEPSAGSDVATLATRATRDGDEWIVNGQKVWTSWGAVAHFGLLIARTDTTVPKHDGLTAFLLDMRTPGVEVRPLRQMTGEREFSEVYLTDVRLDDTARLGDVGDGWRVVITTLMNERVSIGGNVEPRDSGPIAYAIEEWTKVQSRSAFQRDEFMKLWSHAEVLRLSKLRFQAQRTSSGDPGPEGSLLKLRSTVLEQQIMGFVVDLMGSSGMLAFDYDNPPHTRQDGNATALFLWSPSNTIVGGTSEVMRGIIGERILGLAREPSADKNVPWDKIPRSA